MELRNEYEAIRSRAIQGLCVPANQVTVGTVIDAVREAVTACQELADRPPRELTASEKYHLWLSVYDGVFGSTRCTNGSEVIDKIIAAFLEKQREPQVVKFRAARNTSTEVVHMFPADDAPNGCWEWLEPAQEFEVKLP